MNELVKLSELYKEKKLAHAYIISTNNIGKCLNVLLNVIKSIFCNQEYKTNCNKCSLCHLVDIGNLPSLKIIEPDGNIIKKTQINELINSFSKSSQFTKENIYIIKNCEKMNKESANSMLKFLEEPDGNVIGFFITNQLNKVLPTIQSRCQQLKVMFENNESEELNIDEQKYELLMNIVNEYLNKIEIEKNKLILYNKEYFGELEKDDIINVFKIVLNIYKKIYEQKYFNDVELIEFEYLKKYSNDNLIKKMHLIEEILDELMFNVNVELLLDRFVLEMDGINNEII